MQAHRVTATVSEKQSITIEKLPFAAGERVDIIILPEKSRPPENNLYPLRGTQIKYENPTDPAAEADWEALQ